MDRLRDLSGLLTLALLGLLLFSVEPAAAGGSSFEFDRESYHPGDRAFAWSTLYLPDSTDDGPYGAWLASVGDSLGATGIPPDAVYVGDITVHDGPYEPSNVSSPRHARIAFTVPDLAPGEYTIVDCNWPCTAQITDITWGGTMVVAGPAAPPPAPTTATTTTPTTTVPPTAAPAPTTTVADLDVEPLVADGDGSDGPGPRAALAVAGIGLVLAVGAWFRYAGRPSSSPSSAGVPSLGEP